MSIALRSRLPLLLVPLLACGPDKDPLDSLTAVTVGPTGSPSGGDPTGNSNTSGNSTDDPTGGGTSSAGTGGSTGGDETGGSGVDPLCQQYLECVNIVDPAAYGEAETNFGPNSSCWQLTPEIAQMCADACAQSLESYGASFPNEPACGGGGSTSTDATTTTTTTTDGTTTNTTRTTDDPSETTGGSGYGQCGWNPNQAYYACASGGGIPGEVDPNGVSPIDCPNPPPAAGAMCDENGPVDGIGCCLPNGDNYYCGGNNTVVIENCGS
jgi:hypothetical protein